MSPVHKGDGPIDMSREDKNAPCKGPVVNDKGVQSKDREPLLDVRRLRLRRGEQLALSDVDLRLAQGEIHALVGSNGAGKSTLAYALMGSEGYRPQSGDILLRGRSLRDLPMHERARLGVVLAWQEPARIEGLSVRDYLLLGNRHADPGACLERVAMEPSDYLRRMLDKTLSGGERRRIELAAVLATSPRLAILDEPTAGIDLLSLSEVVGVIRGMAKGGCGVLLITHEERVAAMADSASQLCGGRIVCRGAVERVLASYTGRSCLRCNGETCNHD
jgi:Fe-S cluster assembly ATP-binding protein